MIPQRSWLPRRQTIATWQVLVIAAVIAFLVALSILDDSLLLYESPILVEETAPLRNVTVGSVSKLDDVVAGSTFETGWWTPWANSISQPWPEIRTDHPKCIPMNRSIWKDIPDSGQDVRGLLYIKSHKASSSTAEGINVALAHHLAPVSQMKCEHYNRHAFANERWHARRNRTASLLWTLVRHPRARDVSQVYHFRVSRQGMDPQSPAMLDALQRQKSVQANYIGIESIPRGSEKRKDLLVRWMQTKIIKAFDFIGVTERMETSLAVMSLLWHIDPSYLVVLNAKQSKHGSYDAGGRRKMCTKLIPPPNPLPDQLSRYLDSESYPHDHWDFVLYHAVNASLDLTIEKLGKERVQNQAALIRHLQLLSEQTCRPNAIFPCSQQGIYQEEKSNCYIQDSGCAYECVDEVMRAYRRDQLA